MRVVKGVILPNASIEQAMEILRHASPALIVHLWEAAVPKEQDGHVCVPCRKCAGSRPRGEVCLETVSVLLVLCVCVCICFILSILSMNSSFIIFYKEYFF